MAMELSEYFVAIAALLVEIVIVIVFAFAMSKTKWMKIKNEDGSLNYINCIAVAVVFGLLAIVATHYFSENYEGSLINVRDFPVMVGGLVGGPIGGIGAGLIGGVERYFVGGATALPCMIGSIISGLVGGLIWWFAGKKFPKAYVAIIAMFVVECIHVLLVMFVSDPYQTGFDAANVIGIPMIVMNTVGMVLFVLIYEKFIKNESED